MFKPGARGGGALPLLPPVSPPLKVGPKGGREGAVAELVSF